MPIHHRWNFNIDRFLNPFVPPPPWKHIPYPVSYWFGYRKTKPADTGNLMPIFWAFLGVFGAIAMIEAVSKHVHSFAPHHVPNIVGSFVSFNFICVSDEYPANCASRVLPLCSSFTPSNRP